MTRIRRCTCSCSCTCSTHQQSTTSLYLLISVPHQHSVPLVLFYLVLSYLAEGWVSHNPDPRSRTDTFCHAWTGGDKWCIHTYSIHIIPQGAIIHFTFKNQPTLFYPRINSGFNGNVLLKLWFSPGLRLICPVVASHCIHIWKYVNSLITIAFTLTKMNRIKMQ